MLTLSNQQAGYLTRNVVEQYPSRAQVLVEDVYKCKFNQEFDVVTMLGSMEHLSDYPALMAQLQ